MILVFNLAKSPRSSVAWLDVHCVPFRFAGQMLWETWYWLGSPLIPQRDRSWRLEKERSFQQKFEVRLVTGSETGKTIPYSSFAPQFIEKYAKLHYILFMSLLWLIWRRCKLTVDYEHLNTKICTMETTLLINNRNLFLYFVRHESEMPGMHLTDWSVRTENLKSRESQGNLDMLSFVFSLFSCW